MKKAPITTVYDEMEWDKFSEEQKRIARANLYDDVHDEVLQAVAETSAENDAAFEKKSDELSAIAADVLEAINKWSLDDDDEKEQRRGLTKRLEDFIAGDDGT